MGAAYNLTAKRCGPACGPAPGSERGKVVQASGGVAGRVGPQAKGAGGVGGGDGRHVEAPVVVHGLGHGPTAGQGEPPRGAWGADGRVQHGVRAGA